MTENEIAREVVDVAFKIHKLYGPGLLESVYETIMAYELRKRGFYVVQQQPLPVVHEEVRMNLGFRPDLIINRKVIVEVKSLERSKDAKRRRRCDGRWFAQLKYFPEDFTFPFIIFHCFPFDRL
jgi:GxxExxY protein